MEYWDRGLRLPKKSKTNGLACLGLLLSRLEQLLKPGSQRSNRVNRTEAGEAGTLSAWVLYGLSATRSWWGLE